MEAELPDGDRCSALLQNAETVRLVGPPAKGSAGGAAPAPAEDGFVWQLGKEGRAATAAAPKQQQQRRQQPGWQAVSVSELQKGQQLFVLRQGGARHTGVAIEESITER